jgi:hypothetical protein
MTFNNPTISTGITQCYVLVGSSATTSVEDGVIKCA